ncbi:MULTISPECIES: hypothetical protein [Methylobacter]
MRILFSNNGQTNQIRGHSDLLKSLGLGGDAMPVIMFDENGALVGAGRGAENLIDSMSLIKSMRDSQPAVKKPMYFKKQEPLQKSMHGHGATSFDGLLNELENIRRSLS